MVHFAPIHIMEEESPNFIFSWSVLKTDIENVLSSISRGVNIPLVRTKRYLESVQTAELSQNYNFSNPLSKMSKITFLFSAPGYLLPGRHSSCRGCVI